MKSKRFFLILISAYSALLGATKKPQRVSYPEWKILAPDLVFVVNRSVRNVEILLPPEDHGYKLHSWVKRLPEFGQLYQVSENYNTHGYTDTPIFDEGYKPSMILENETKVFSNKNSLVFALPNEEYYHHHPNDLSRGEFRYITQFTYYLKYDVDSFFLNKDWANYRHFDHEKMKYEKRNGTVTIISDTMILLASDFLVNNEKWQVVHNNLCVGDEVFEDIVVSDPRDRFQRFFSDSDHEFYPHYEDQPLKDAAHSDYETEWVPEKPPNPGENTEDEIREYYENLERESHIYDGTDFDFDDISHKPTRFERTKEKWVSDPDHPDGGYRVKDRMYGMPYKKGTELSGGFFTDETLFDDDFDRNQDPPDFEFDGEKYDRYPSEYDIESDPRLLSVEEILAVKTERIIHNKDPFKDFKLEKDCAPIEAGRVRHDATDMLGLNRFIYGTDREITTVKENQSEPESSRWYFKAPKKYNMDWGAAFGGKITFSLGTFAGNFQDRDQFNEFLDVVVLECASCSTYRPAKMVYRISNGNDPINLLDKLGDETTFTTYVEIDLSPGPNWMVDSLNSVHSFKEAQICEFAIFLKGVSGFYILGDYTKWQESVALDDVKIIVTNPGPESGIPDYCYP